MDIMSFIPSQRQAILGAFSASGGLGLGAVRIGIEGCLIPAGIIYECFILAGGELFSDQAVVISALSL